jgi:hypothetical protein
MSYAYINSILLPFKNVGLLCDDDWITAVNDSLSTCSREILCAGKSEVLMVCVCVCVCVGGSSLQLPCLLSYLCKGHLLVPPSKPLRQAS